MTDKPVLSTDNGDKMTDGEYHDQQEKGEYVISINRRAYSQDRFDEDYDYEKLSDRVTCLGAARSYFFPGEYTLAERTLSLFPVISILRNYRLADDLPMTLVK